MHIGLLGLSLTAQLRSIGISVSIGSGLFITGATLTATASPLDGGETITYQWQDDGVNITGATASTYAPTIGVAGVADASAITCDVTVDGTTYTSNSRTVAYAAGTAPAIADGQEWFANSTNTTIDASASGANLTFSYVLTGAPTGVTINASTGLITVAPTAITSGTITITATDQYGRVLTDTFTFTSVEVSIALSAFSVVQNGTDFDVAVTVTDDPDIPLEFYLVGLATGATAPSAAQIIAGTDSTDTAATIVLTFSTSVTGAQTETITTPADGTYDFYMVARDTDLDVSNTVSDIGVVYATPASSSYTYLGLSTSDNSTSIQSASIDIGLAAADRYIIVATSVQAADPAPTVVVNGVTLTEITWNATTGLGVFGGLVASGAGPQTVSATFDTAAFQWKTFAVWRADGLASTTPKQTLSLTGASSGTIAVDAGDYMFALGRLSGVNAVTWSTTTEVPDGDRQLTSNAAFTANAADWTVDATNASFSLSANGGSFCEIEAVVFA